MQQTNNSEDNLNGKIKRAGHAKLSNDAVATPADTAAPQKKKSKAPLVIGVVLSGIILIAAIVGGLVFGCSNNIKNNLKYDGNSEALNAVLSQSSSAYEPFYVLIIGSDEWEDNGARSDCMTLTRVDLNNALVTMVSCPRDTPYLYKGTTIKLNNVYTRDGDAACVEAVSELTGVPISHFVEIKFNQLETLVDALGGIDVNVPFTIDYDVYTHDQPTVHIDAGMQHLNGIQAVALSRSRVQYTTDAPQDAVRQTNIRNMMVAIMKTILKKPANEIPGYINMLSSMVKTDIPMEDLIDWALVMSKADNVTVYSCSGPYEGGRYNNNETNSSTGEWLTDEAPEQWAALMAAVDAGLDPNTAMKSKTTYEGAVTIGSQETVNLSD